ncbi:MAG: tRNA pseudouridine(55) synthase TruB [Clostridia bacterium]|nr:tRNA pseudouridine(55) synthase TruB [Clostridia bacterium]
MDGVIVVNKPAGKTSHDIVSFMRRLTGVKKVGHTGTLDPGATGVLPICIGRATKAADMLTFSDKRYVAELILGMTTDTQDSEGEVLSECEVTVREDDIKTVIGKFVGEIKQKPPMYSAIKHNGKKLYELARSGIEVERKERTIFIYSLNILDIDMKCGKVTIDVCCSKGTYIRTLCEDIGMALGCGAYMNMLKRIKSGMFEIEKSHTLDELVRLKDEGRLSDVLVPVDELFFEYPKLFVDEWQKTKIINGMRIVKDGLTEGGLYRVYDEETHFLCVSKVCEGKLVLDKAFW